MSQAPRPDRVRKAEEEAAAREAFARLIADPAVWELVNPTVGITTEAPPIEGLVATHFRRRWAALARERGGINVGDEDGAVQGPTQSRGGANRGARRRTLVVLA